jgi:multiple sugar transport system permease protein
VPVIARVGRKSLKTRILIGSIYLVLIGGSVTTVYPFWLMLSGSVATNHTTMEFKLIPRYLYEERGLFEAHMFLKYYRYGGIGDIWRQWKLRFPIQGLENRWTKIPGYRPGPDNPIGVRLTTNFCVDPFDPFFQSYQALVEPARWTPAFQKLVKKHYPFAVEAVREAVGESKDFKLTRDAFFRLVKPAFQDYLGRFAKDFDDAGQPAPSDPRYKTFFERYPELRDNVDFQSAMREYFYCRKPDLSDPRVRRHIEEYYEFCRSLPVALRDGYYFGGYHRQFEGDLLYQDWLKKKYKTLEALNRAYRTDTETWVLIAEPYDNLHNRSAYIEDTPANRDWFEWKSQAPAKYIRPAGTEYEWSKFLEGRYGRNIEKLNDAYQAGYLRFFDVALAEQTPEGEGPARMDWIDFVRKRIAPRYIHFEGGHQEWATFLQKELGGLERINRQLERSWTSQAEIRLPDLQARAVGTPKAKKEFDLIVKFVAGDCPIEVIRLDTPENLYRRFVKNRYGSVAVLNEAYGLDVSSFDELYFPAPAADWKELEENRSGVRWFTFKRAYAHVVDHVIRNRRSLWNTTIFCTAVVLSALIINPLCAYALSRFNLPGAYKILLFLLATMAFPTEVTMIPNFLLLKTFPLLRIICCVAGAAVGGILAGTLFSSKRVIYPFLGTAIGGGLGVSVIANAITFLFDGEGRVSLLNTYWALVLPSVANGYAIFILKGFFDSLPQEIYESAVIDGAGELRIFTQITLPMSTPVLAVIGLWSFTAAYGSFTWAFVICQDPDMWTLMVHLYQYIMVYDPAEDLAALTLASIPTLIVFLGVQKVILKGIILPTYK